MGSINRLLTTETQTGRVGARVVTGRFGTLALERDFVRPAAVGMGAALHYGVADAAVPAGEDQIEDVLAFCSTTYGIRSQQLQDRLRGNLRWVEYLEERERRVPPGSTALAAAERESLARAEAARRGEAPTSTPLRPRTELPRFAPRAEIRVRL